VASILEPKKLVISNLGHEVYAFKYLFLVFSVTKNSKVRLIFISEMGV
jgi:hypothetical protein